MQQLPFAYVGSIPKTNPAITTALGYRDGIQPAGDGVFFSPNATTPSAPQFFKLTASGLIFPWNIPQGQLTGILIDPGYANTWFTGQRGAMPNTWFDGPDFASLIAPLFLENGYPANPNINANVRAPHIYAHYKGNAPRAAQFVTTRNGLVTMTSGGMGQDVLTLGFLGFKDIDTIFVGVDMVTSLAAPQYWSGYGEYSLKTGALDLYASFQMSTPDTVMPGTGGFFGGGMVGGSPYWSSVVTSFSGGMYVSDKNGTVCNNLHNKPISADIALMQQYVNAFGDLTLTNGTIPPIASSQNTYWGWRHFAFDWGVIPSLGSSTNGGNFYFLPAGVAGDYKQIAVGVPAGAAAGTVAPFAIKKGAPQQIVFNRFMRPGSNPALGFIDYKGFLMWNKKPLYVIDDSTNAQANVYDLYAPLNAHYAIAFSGMRNFTRPISPTYGDNLS